MTFVYRGKEAVRIGTVEMYLEEAEAYYTEGRYLLTSTAVWQIMYSSAQNQYYGHRVYWQKGARFCRPGRYHAMKGEDVNKIIGCNLLR